MAEPTIYHVCPSCQRAFDSPSVCLADGSQTVPTPGLKPTVKPSLDDLPGTCDWGYCDREATAWRRSTEHGWLPVCDAHSAPEQGAHDAPQTTNGKRGTR